LQQGDVKQFNNNKLTAVEAPGDKSKTLRSFTWDGRLSSDLPSYLFDWKQRIFGTDDKFKTDWPSKSLEAWIYQDSFGANVNSKIPFGHKRLQYGLNQVIKAGQNGKSTWNRYLELSRLRRMALDQLLDEANDQQTRERVCIAFHECDNEQGNSFMLVFMSIRKEPKPISFKDAVGRRYTLPFEICRKWDVSVHFPPRHPLQFDNSCKLAK
jgi:hypothetical protein